MHPPLFPFLSKTRWLSFLGHALDWDEEKLKEAGVLLDKNLLPIIAGVEISHFLGVSPKIIGLMAARPARFYNTYKVPKKSGGFRTITAPRVYLKQIQRYLLDCILANESLPDCVVGFTRGKTSADGAAIHSGNTFLLNIDIKNFFPSVTKTQVVDAFQAIGYNEKSSEFLAKLSTLDNVLPQGAPTSPALSNLVFQKTDLNILKICAENRISYSRYADDLSFSSNAPIENSFQDSIKNTIHEAGFCLNNEKTRLLGPRCRREVTGIVINERIGIPRIHRRRIRAIFHKASANPYGFSTRRSELAGYIGWIGQLHSEEAENYRDILSRIPTDTTS